LTSLFLCTVPVLTSHQPARYLFPQALEPLMLYQVQSLCCQATCKIPPRAIPAIVFSIKSSTPIITLEPPCGKDIKRKQVSLQYCASQLSSSNPAPHCHCSPASWRLCCQTYWLRSFWSFGQKSRWLMSFFDRILSVPACWLLPICLNKCKHSEGSFKQAHAESMRIFHVGHMEARWSHCRAALMQTRDDMQNLIRSLEFFRISLWKDAPLTMQQHKNTPGNTATLKIRSPFTRVHSQCLFFSHTRKDWKRKEKVHKHALMTSYNLHQV